MDPSFHSNRVITVTEKITVQNSTPDEVTLDICSRHIIGYADGVIRTVDGHITYVTQTRMDIRHLMETALLT